MDKQQSRPEDQGLKQFAQDWKNDENLQKKFVENASGTCDQYHIRGENKQEMIKMAKEGKNLKERVSTFLARALPGKKSPGGL